MVDLRSIRIKKTGESEWEATFKLLPDLRWSDGAYVTPRDVEFSIQRLSDPEFNSSIYSHIMDDGLYGFSAFDGNLSFRMAKPFKEVAKR